MDSKSSQRSPRRSASCGTLLVLFLLPLSAYSVEVLVDRIIASINGKPALYQDVKRKVDKGPLVALSEYPSTEKSDSFSRALDDAINIQLVLSQAKDLNIDFSDAQIEEEITKFLKERNLNHESLKNYLSQEGVNYEQYKEDFKLKMILSRFQGAVIAPQVKVTSRDIEKFYLAEENKISDTSVLTLKQIVIQIPTDGDPALKQNKEKLAQEAYTKLKDGLKFDDVVKIYSDDEESKNKGGLLGDFSLKEISPKIRTAIENLSAGQFSEPVHIGSTIQIFQILEKKVGQDKEFEAKKPEIEKRLRMQEVYQQTNRWLADQRARSEIRVIKD